MDLTTYDIILINTSAGKDSQAMMDYVCALATEQRVLHRVVAVHSDLGRVEWKGTKDLAAEHAAHYGIRFEVIRRRQGDLLDHVRQRRKWPAPKQRYCTSDHKRAQVYRVMTKLVDELGFIHGRLRILNCMGHRADESPARAKMPVFEHDSRASNGKRYVDTWRPLHSWTVQQVWQRIRHAGTRHHFAYDLGMPRLSCCLCIYAPKSALILAGKHNPELLAEYVKVEAEIGHTFRQDVTLHQIQLAVESGEAVTNVPSWEM